METKQEQEKHEHEERKTEVYNISDALHELEVDLRHNAKFPKTDWNGKKERTDLIRISGGWGAPSLIINKTQCRKWMREHFQQEPTQPSKHWEKEGQLYVSLRRSTHWVWVSCGENRFRTAESKAGIQAGEDARDALFAVLEDEAPPQTDGDE
jgi:hypothetical protein